MANILCIGVDEDAMKSRHTALERAGHTVSQAKDIRQVVAACSGIRFDVIILGQSLPAKEKLRVYDLIRQHGAGAKVLELHNGPAEISNADAHIRVTGGAPTELVDVISGLTGRRRSA
jgi:DNA-binding response OmpR family regulator